MLVVLEVVLEEVMEEDMAEDTAEDSAEDTAEDTVEDMAEDTEGAAATNTMSTTKAITVKDPVTVVGAASGKNRGRLMLLVIIHVLAIRIKHKCYLDVIHLFIYASNKNVVINCSQLCLLLPNYSYQSAQ